MISTDLLAPGRARAVADLLDAVIEHDGISPLDEAARLALRERSRRPGIHHLLVAENADADADENSRVIAYASILADGTAQGMVHPAHRRRGHGRALLAAVLETRPDAGVWDHGALDGALALLTEAGLAPVRTLLTLERPLDQEIEQRPARVDGVEVGTFDPARDAEDLLAVNAQAFADHPEQGSLDTAGLAARMAEDWFDARGLHLARRDGRLASFVWTKREPGAETAEIYVVGTAPEAQGSGIAGMLLRRALADLRERGARRVELYVEADNPAALGLYERLGFEVAARDVQFRARSRTAVEPETPNAASAVPAARSPREQTTAPSRAEDTGLVGDPAPGDAAEKHAGGAPTSGADLPDLPEDRFLERELSWLAFNERVQELSADPGTPLLERAGFCAIFSANLDEFFMVRVAGLKRRLETGLAVAGASGMPPRQVLDRVRRRAHELQIAQSRIVQDLVRPDLEQRADLRILAWEDLTAAQRGRLTDFFATDVFPVLTPLAVDPAHPFPYISGLSLNLVVSMRPEAPRPEDEDGERSAPTEAAAEEGSVGPVRHARLKVPDALPRFVRVLDGDEEDPLDVAGGARFVPLEDVLAANLGQLFPGMEIIGHHLFRVTRNEDLEVEEDDAENLLDALEKEILRRRFGAPVRLELEEGIAPEVRDWLVRELGVMSAEVVELPGLLDLRGLAEIADLDLPELRYPAFVPATHRHLNQVETSRPADVLGAIRARDILLHHPYDSFSTSVQAFLEQAAADPSVLAIKQTLYRTSGDSPIVDALIDAAEAGKQVLALVEIKARFDEQANISWARKLEQAGVHVVYGIVGLKTHAKLSMVVRREKGGLRRYCHVGTGNYHPKTARRYEDLGLLTCDPAVGEDLTRLFNQLSGYAPRTAFERLLVAPRSVRSGLVELIEQEIEHHQAGRPARIRLKGNSMVDERIIDALYRASRAGLPVDIVVRGICALRPGVPGLSENIRVRSILGRFLEHSRIFAFEGGGEPVVMIGSADMMHRNLDRRVEALVRITAPDHQEELVRLIDLEMDDATQSWHLGADGTWARHVLDASGERLQDAQAELIARHRRRRRRA